MAVAGALAPGGCLLAGTKRPKAKAHVSELKTPLPLQEGSSLEETQASAVAEHSSSIGSKLPHSVVIAVVVVAVAGLLSATLLFLVNARRRVSVAEPVYAA